MWCGIALGSITQSTHREELRWYSFNGRPCRLGYRTKPVEIASARLLDSPRIPEIAFGRSCRSGLAARRCTSGLASGPEQPIGTSPISKGKRPQNHTVIRRSLVSVLS